jgi:membrane associated rhomboid family serine protease
MACCLVVNILISVEIGRKAEELENTAKELLNYYIQHPYLKLDPGTKRLLFGEKENEDVEKMLATYRRRESRKIHLFQEDEQQKLDQLSQKLKNIIDDVPYRKYGFIPAQKSFIGLFTYMFIHGGWMHLIGNMLLLYLTGPFIEDVWGRPIFTAFYVIAGLFSGFMFSLYYPNFMGPLIGASGAVAGLMGAFLIRYWRTKIKFFFFFFFIHGTFKAPAWVMLPIWLALEIFSANAIDSVNAEGGGVAHWAHIWGFILGVVVAVGMKRLKIEEKHVHPKIEAQVHFVDEGYKAFEEATQKKNEGKSDEAFALLLIAARKNPMDKDVVEGLWNQGKELGKEKEAAEFYIRMIESEIRRNLMDVAFTHFSELKEKVPQASVSMTCKFTLMTYLTERQDYKAAKELASELIEEVDLNSSPGLLQKFASAASEHSPEIAKKVIELCLKHPGITDEQKEALKTKLKELQSGLPGSPPVSDMGEAHAVASNTEQLTAELESKLGLKPESEPVDEPEVQPLAESVGQTREELIGQRGSGPNSPPEVEPGSQPADETESEPVVEPEGQPSVVPETQSAVEPEGQAGLNPEGQLVDESEVQPLAESVGQTREELRGQRGPGPNAPPEVEPESQPIDEPEGQAGIELEGQQAIEPEDQSGLSPEVQPVAEPEGQPSVVPESQPLAEREVQPLAESVGQTREELRGQRGPEPNAAPEVESESQPVDEPEGQGVETEGLPIVDPDKPERSPSLNQPIMAVKATPLSVNNGKIALSMDEIGQQLLPLNKVKSIAVAEIAHDKETPFLLIDLFLDDPKTKDHKIRSIRLLSTSFDPTIFSPGIQDRQDALKVFVSVLLKLSGATAYPDEDSILLEAPQSFSSIENYEKLILS